METKDKQINQLSIKNGLLIGAISIVLAIVFRIIDPMLQFTNVLAQFASFVIQIALIIVLAIDIRKKNGGYWTFGQAYRSLIINAIFIMLLSTIFNFVLFKFVDPELPHKVADATAAKMEERLSKMGMDQTKIDKTMEMFTNGEFEAKLKPTFKTEVTNLGVGILIYAIINLIIAAIIKKNEPLFYRADDLDNPVEPPPATIS